MLDVSRQMQRFREASCFLWNNFLKPEENTLRLDVEESFEVIERELLRCLVLSDYPESAERYRGKPIEKIVVTAASHISQISFQVASRDIHGNLIWSNLRTCSADDFPELQFFDFFDWDHYVSVSYEYVRARNPSTEQLYLITQDQCSYWLGN